MPLASCARCNKLFNKDRLPICPDCLPEEEADYEKVRQYLEERPNETALQVAEGTGVSEACVLRLIDEGKIRRVDDSTPVACGQCGAPAISLTKRLCESCLVKLNLRLAQEQAKIKLPPRKTFNVDDRPVRQVLEEKRRI